MKNIINSIFLENFLLKFVSLLIAVVIWYFVNNMLMATKTFSVPINVYRPADYILSAQQDENGKHVDSVLVEFRGPKNILRTLQRPKISCDIQIVPTTAGENEIQRTVVISEANFSLPPEISISANPSKITFVLLKKIKKQVRALKKENPFVNENPEFKYRLTATDTVEIEGPYNVVQNIEHLYIKEIDVSGRENHFTVPLQFELPENAGNVNITQNWTAYINIEKINNDEK